MIREVILMEVLDVQDVEYKTVDSVERDHTFHVHKKFRILL